MPRDNVTKVCDVNQSKCYADALIDLETNTAFNAGHDVYNSLICNCLSTCNSIEYDTDVSQISLDWNHFLVALKQPMEGAEQ